MRAVVVVLLVVAWTWCVPPVARAAWRAPVPGAVVGRFHVGPDPYARGQRRGVDLAASPGTWVVAPCSGRISFAGRVPRYGGGVSLRCGPLTATLLGLADVDVAAGASLQAGAPLGTAGGRGRVRLGARRTARRFGYVDPLRLLARPRAAPPSVAPAPLRGPRVRPSTRPPAAMPPAARPARHPAPRPAGPPLAAWAGAALLACALCAGGARGIAVRRRRPRAARTGASQTAG